MVGKYHRAQYTQEFRLKVIDEALRVTPTQTKYKVYDLIPTLVHLILVY